MCKKYAKLFTFVSLLFILMMVVMCSRLKNSQNLDKLIVDELKKLKAPHDNVAVLVYSEKAGFLFRYDSKSADGSTKMMYCTVAKDTVPEPFPRPRPPGPGNPDARFILFEETRSFTEDENHIDVMQVLGSSEPEDLYLLLRIQSGERVQIARMSSGGR